MDINLFSSVRDLQLRLARQDLLNQLHHSLRTPIRSLIPPPPMPIIMHNPLPPLDPLLLNPHTPIPQRPQSDPMSNNTQRLNPLSIRQLRTHLYRPLHNPDRLIRINLRLPVPLLVRTTQNRASTSCSLHNIRDLVVTVISTGNSEHSTRCIPHNDDLSTTRNDVLVHHAAEFGG